MTDRRRPNRLAGEKSPYLLQHAFNPVDWRPWTEEAFAEAGQADKLVFLSIGYATCHWCHVMERESFEDAKVAALLNAHFVPIKVDREERPDLDRYFMSVCQQLTGSGGWPLTIVLTPDRTPFFAGTYFPKRARFGRPGLLEMLPRLAEIWRSRRDDVRKAASEIASIAFRPQPGEAGPLEGAVLKAAFESLEGEFDRAHGGFGAAPKFPTPHHLLFLLRYGARTRNPAAFAMVEKTLSEMRLGGVYDHLGFGFHRYSTDPFWRVPHFEKMLYDQAMAAMAYTEAFQATRDLFYRETAEEILTYVRRDLTSGEGPFYAAEDADAEGEEGKSYLWTVAEMRAALGASESDIDLGLRLFKATPEGDALEPGASPAGRNVLRLAKTLEASAVDFNMPTPELKTRMERIRKSLFEARAQRPRPLRDTKILADWNGLMIAALSKAAQAFQVPAYAAAAKTAADVILERMRIQEGGLFHRLIGDEARIPGFLDDYAFMIWGLIELYEALLEPRYLRTALDFAQFCLRRFWDGTAGGFYFTPDDVHDLPVREKDPTDGAYPSGNAVMMLNLTRLSRMTGDPALADRAEETGRAFARSIARIPTAYTFWMSALEFFLSPSLEIVIAGRLGSPRVRALLATVRGSFLPNKVLVHRPEGAEGAEIVAMAPYLEHLRTGRTGAAAFVCTNFACHSPVSEPEDLARLISTPKNVRS